MIHDKFEEVLASRWGEFLIPDMDKNENKSVTHPVALAFMSLDNPWNKEKDDGSVTCDPKMEKHWQTLEKEYSISRLAAQVLMIVARKYPSIVRIGKLDEKRRKIGVREFALGLEELSEAGVLEKTVNGSNWEYELSHDLLASVVFEQSYAELWKETQALRATGNSLERFQTETQDCFDKLSKQDEE